MQGLGLEVGLKVHSRQFNTGLASMACHFRAQAWVWANALVVGRGVYGLGFSILGCRLRV